LHEFRHAGVASVLVGTFHPGEHHGFTLLRLRGAAEIGELAIGHVVAPALHPRVAPNSRKKASKVRACAMNLSRSALGGAIMNPSM
jgi:hypothetical protein